jgi:hypothetical protein
MDFLVRFAGPQVARQMQEYRAYTMDPEGHFIGYEPMVCANDSEAFERAKGLVGRHAIELWSGPRLVIRLERKEENDKK